jgi:hypothetical protein
VTLAVRSTLCVALIAGAFLAPREASSQQISSPFAFVEEKQEIGTFTGYMSAGKGRFGYAPAGGYMLGGRYGLDLSGPLGLELAGGVIRGKRDIVNPARPAGNRVIGQADVLLTSFDGRLRLSATGARTWHGISPFLSFGGGVVFDTKANSTTEQLILDADELFDFGTKFFAIIGPGVRWHVTRRLAVRTDFGLTLWQIDTPAGFGDPALGFPAVAENEWVSGLSVTGSVLFRW